MKPNAEKIFSILIELYAKQNGVKVTYQLESEGVHSESKNERES